ncbi:TSUP family transporter [Roseomonas terrae]|uniref:Probable membrane transporter protein n=1 Tax=Neoroseomonas terrae TaxID=424799 RepID=A0ABS5ECM1_9PROT|nr:TSUP family transporter [Neoroseomonas terrae]MBR0648759.1 TSUP family transporter [Neoroseomonas terrae]
MSPLLTAALILTMVGTSLLSGVFGMAGGLVLVGVLLVLLPVPDAMALHAVTQVASNGWRAALWWRRIRPWPVVAHAAGCLVALGAWSLVLLVPDRGAALLLLGASPFLAQALPARIRPNPQKPLHGAIVGAISMSLMVLTGVSGPLLDRHFLGGAMDRREIVATKAACQAIGHALKLVYFGLLVADAGQIDPWLAAMAVVASMTGTMLAKRLLEAMSDTTYRLWAGRIVTALGGFYIGQGGWLLLTE